MAALGRTATVVCRIGSILLLRDVSLLVRTSAFCRCFTWSSFVKRILFEHCGIFGFHLLVCLGSVVCRARFWYIAKGNTVILTNQLVVFVFHHQVLVLLPVVQTSHRDKCLRKAAILTIHVLLSTMHVRCLFSAFTALLSQIAGRNDRRSFFLLRFLDAIALFCVARLEYGQGDSAFAVHIRMLMSSQLALSYRSLLSGCGATGGPAQQLGTAVLVSSMSGGPGAYILQQLILTIASLRVLIFGEYFVAIYVMTAG